MLTDDSNVGRSSVMPRKVFDMGKDMRWGAEPIFGWSADSERVGAGCSRYALGRGVPIQDEPPAVTRAELRTFAECHAGEFPATSARILKLLNTIEGV